jgi:hypothetical protein
MLVQTQNFGLGYPNRANFARNMKISIHLVVPSPTAELRPNATPIHASQAIPLAYPSTRVEEEGWVKNCDIWIFVNQRTQIALTTAWLSWI